ncbi:unnamed protein product [Periconia digitata]|uniref:Uncharacterized protein n=1 Tax=Periconia digitata TaxID=1303443 RepID=A0A9W4XG73_9PLEO|nr:unnamed protein product [Periconia digitata]
MYLSKAYPTYTYVGMLTISQHSTLNTLNMDQLNRINAVSKMQFNLFQILPLQIQPTTCCPPSHHQPLRHPSHTDTSRTSIQKFSTNKMADKTKSNGPILSSDGKRMRLVWHPKDGNGESAQHLIDRSMSTLKGHPSWKLYMEDIKLPIDRDNDDAPPRYVYLDDKACYTIWASKVYLPHELKEFWPFDFNFNGIVRSGRMNRGRPAWKDEAQKEYAKAPTRGKGNTYEFVGDLEVTPYEPLRATRQVSKTEQRLAKERAEKGEGDANNENPSTPDTGRRPPVKVGKSVQRVLASQINKPGPNLPVTDEKDLYPRRANLDHSKHMQWQTPKRALPESSLQLGIKPLPLPARPDDDPTFQTKSHSRTEITGGINLKRKLTGSPVTGDRQQGSPVKKARSAKFAGSNGVGDLSSPSRKRRQPDE